MLRLVTLSHLSALSRWLRSQHTRILGLHDHHRSASAYSHHPRLVSGTCMAFIVASLTLRICSHTVPYVFCCYNLHRTASFTFEPLNVLRNGDA